MIYKTMFLSFICLLFTTCSKKLNFNFLGEFNSYRLVDTSHQIPFQKNVKNTSDIYKTSEDLITFLHNKNTWKRYWHTLPAPEYIAQFYKKDKEITHVLLVGKSWVSMNVDNRQYHLSLSPSEKNELLSILKHLK